MAKTEEEHNLKERQDKIAEYIKEADKETRKTVSDIRMQGFYGVAQKLGLFLFVCMTVVTALQVIFRYVLSIPMPWTEELARYLMIWVTFIGAGVVTRRRLHIQMDLLIDRVTSPKWKLIMLIAINVVILGFLMPAFYGSIIMIPETWNSKAASMDFIRTSHIYAGVAIGLFLMIIAVPVAFYESYQEIFKNEKDKQNAAT